MVYNGLDAAKKCNDKVNEKKPRKSKVKGERNRTGRLNYQRRKRERRIERKKQRKKIRKEKREIKRKEREERYEKIK